MKQAVKEVLCSLNLDGFKVSTDTITKVIQVKGNCNSTRTRNRGKK